MRAMTWAPDLMARDNSYNERARRPTTVIRPWINPAGRREDGL
jgi:hypothetical protein